MDEQKIEFSKKELDALKIMFEMMGSVLEYSHDLYVSDYDNFNSNDLFNLKCKLGIYEIIQIY